MLISHISTFTVKQDVLFLLFKFFTSSSIIFFFAW